MNESSSLRTPLIKRFVEACGILYKNKLQKYWSGAGDVYSLLSVYDVHSSEGAIYSFTIYYNKQL